MQSSPVAVDTLRTLLKTQPLAVMVTQQGGHPYTSLVAFAASEDLRRIVFVTSRATTKYRNLFDAPCVSLLIDSRSDAVPACRRDEGQRMVVFESMKDIRTAKAETETRLP